MSTAISVESVGKRYRLGVIGGGTLQGDVSRWWARLRHKPNPLARVGETMDTTTSGGFVWALRDVSFAVEEGEAVGIIGRNGAGKSTVLKILSRVTAPTSGVVRMRGRVGSLLEVGTGFHPELTGRENIYLNGSILGMQRKEITARLDGIIEFAEIDAYVDTPVKRYSSGMYVRLAFAVAAHLLPEILIVDEVLAVGDLAFQQKCLGKMKDVAEHGRTVLFVSHNMASVRTLCTRGILLSEGKVKLDGDVDEAVRAYLPTLDVSSQADLEAAEGRSGNGRARFTAVAFRNQYGTPANSFQIGDDILVDVVIRTRETLRTGVLKVGLFTSEGLQVTALNPQIDSGFEIGRLDGTAVIRAVFRDQRLYPGAYRLSLRLEDAGGEVLDSVPAAAAFQVAPGGPRVARQLGSGVVHLTPEWSREV